MSKPPIYIDTRLTTAFPKMHHAIWARNFRLAIKAGKGPFAKYVRQRLPRSGWKDKGK